jgi:hypothetical protein
MSTGSCPDTDALVMGVEFSVIANYVPNVALIACADCGRQISDIAAACPQCGRPVDALARARALRGSNAPPGDESRPSQPIKAQVDPLEATARVIKRKPLNDPSTPKECEACGKDTSDDVFRKKKDNGRYICLECQEQVWEREERKRSKIRNAFRIALIGVLIVIACLGLFAGLASVADRPEMTTKGQK